MTLVAIVDLENEIEKLGYVKYSTSRGLDDLTQYKVSSVSQAKHIIVNKHNELSCRLVSQQYIYLAAFYGIFTLRLFGRVAYCCASFGGRSVTQSCTYFF